MRPRTVDPAFDKLYWADAGLLTVNRANPDGSAPEVLVDSTPARPFGITIDNALRTIYWVENNSGFSEDSIMRANLDGGNIDVVLDNLAVAGKLTLDGSTNKIYWIAWVSVPTERKIQRAIVNGSDLEDLVTGLESPSDLLIDDKTRKLYWADAKTNKIQRANLDGTDIEDVERT